MAAAASPTGSKNESQALPEPAIEPAGPAPQDDRTPTADLCHQQLPDHMITSDHRNLGPHAGLHEQLP